jgi:hypothetical protein
VWELVGYSEEQEVVAARLSGDAFLSRVKWRDDESIRSGATMGENDLSDSRSVWNPAGTTYPSFP